MAALLDERRLRAAVRDWSRLCGKRVQQRRIALGWKQDKLGQLAGVRNTTISKIELGLIVPKESVKLSIAAALLCEVADLWPPLERSYVTAVAQAEVA